MKYLVLPKKNSGYNYCVCASDCGGNCGSNCGSRCGGNCGRNNGGGSGCGVVAIYAFRFQ